MKTLCTFAGSLALSALLLTAHAQTPVTSHDNPGLAKSAGTKTADHRAATYKGPHVVKDTKALGSKMMRASKPAPQPVAPVKQ